MRQRQCRDERAEFGFGSGPALPTLGAAQRASLGRGLAIVLGLTLACMILVSAPLLGASAEGPGPAPARAVASGSRPPVLAWAALPRPPVVAWAAPPHPPVLAWAAPPRPH